MQHARFAPRERITRTSGRRLPEPVWRALLARSVLQDAMCRGVVACVLQAATRLRAAATMRHATRALAAGTAWRAAQAPAVVESAQWAAFRLRAAGPQRHALHALLARTA